MPSSATGRLGPFINDTIVVLGTAGTDWVPCVDAGGAPVACTAAVGVSGQIHTILLENNRRVPTLTGGAQVVGTTACPSGPCTDWTTASARTRAGQYGVLQEPDPIPLTAAHRVYGNIAIAGQVAYVPLVRGQGGDPMSMSKSLGGKMLEINLGAAATTQAAAEMANVSLATFGGVAVFSVDQGGGNFKTIMCVDPIVKTVKFAGPAGPPAGDIRAPKKSLSTNMTLPYRLYNTIRRFLSQQ